jgi:hypothetical protein
MKKRISLIVAGIAAPLSAMALYVQGVGATQPTPDYSALTTATSNQIQSVPALVAGVAEPIIFATLVVGALALAVRKIRSVVGR